MKTRKERQIELVNKMANITLDHPLTPERRKEFIAVAIELKKIITMSHCPHCEFDLEKYESQ